MKQRLAFILSLCLILFTAAFQTALPLRVCEADGSPCRSGVGTLTVPNGSLSVAGSRATVLQGPRYAVANTATASSSTLTGANGEAAVLSTLSENVTLSTAGATTDSTIDLPAGSIILSVVARITVDIAGVNSTTLSVGDPTTAARFGTTTTLTAGTVITGITQMNGNISTTATGPTQAAAAKCRLTLSGGADNTPSAGAVRIAIIFIQFTAPTS